MHGRTTASLSYVTIQYDAVGDTWGGLYQSG